MKFKDLFLSFNDLPKTPDSEKLEFTVVKSVTSNFDYTPKRIVRIGTYVDFEVVIWPST